MEYMSQEGYDELVAELRQMETVELPRVRDAIAEARDKGDLSENFEYYAAKRDKNRNESRIRYLERLIKTATIIEDDTQDDEIGLYSVVDLYMEEDDETMTVKVVTSIRGDSMKGFISIDSPLGKAIKGHKLGDRIYIKVSDDYGYYVVVKGIEQTMDDGTDDIRSY